MHCQAEPLKGSGCQTESTTPAASLTRRLKGNFLWAAAGRFASVLFLLCLHMTLAHQLTPADYGRYVVAESMILLLSLLMMAGLPSIGLRTIRLQLVSGTRHAAAETAVTALMTLVVTGVIIGMTVIVFSNTAGVESFNGLLRQFRYGILLWAFGAAALRLISELFRGYELLGLSYFVGGQSGGFGVNAVLLVVCLSVGLLQGITLNSVLTIQSFVQGIAVLAAVAVLLSVTAEDRKTWGIRDIARRTASLLRSSLPVLVQQLVVFGLPELDLMLLGQSAPAEQIALYGSAKRLIFFATVPLLLVNHAVQPFITELHSAGNREALSRILRGSATIAGTPGLLCILAFLLVPGLILSTMFGPAYAAAGSILRVLCIGASAFLLTGSCGLVLTMTGHERAGMVSALVTCGLYLAIAPSLISAYGIRGAAAATTGLQLCSNAVTMLLVYRYEKIWTSMSFSPKMLQDFLKSLRHRKSHPRPQFSAETSSQSVTPDTPQT